MFGSTQNVEYSSDQTIIIFSEVIQKNNEMLKSLLPKMHNLYQLNEQMQTNFNDIKKRMAKMEKDQENLHYQMRTSNHALEGKLNKIYAQNSNIIDNVSKVKKQLSFINTNVMPSNHKSYTERNLKKGNIFINSNKTKDKKIMFADEIDRVQPSESRANEKKSSIILEIQYNQQLQKIDCIKEKQSEKQLLSSSPAVKSHSSRQIMKSKVKSKKLIPYSHKQLSNNKTKKSLTKSQSKNSFKSTQRFNQREVQYNDYEMSFKEIDSVQAHNIKIKQNYQQLLFVYQQNNDIKFKQINVKIQDLAAQIHQFDKNQIVQLFKQNFLNQVGQLRKRLAKFNCLEKGLDCKVDKKEFELFESDCNLKLNKIHQANRDETATKIQFLQAKINSLIKVNYQQRKKTTRVDVDKHGCFKIISSKQKENLIASPKKLNQTKGCLRQIASISQSETMQRYVSYDAETKNKRQIESLHTATINGWRREKRYNDENIQWKRNTSNQKQNEKQAKVRRSPSPRKDPRINITLLKDKTIKILQHKAKPRLKKQRIIFEYD